MGRTKNLIITIIITTYTNLYLYAVNPNLYTEQGWWASQNTTVI